MAKMSNVTLDPKSPSYKKEIAIRTELIIRNVKDAVWYTAQNDDEAATVFLNIAAGLTANEPELIKIFEVSALVEPLVQNPFFNNRPRWYTALTKTGQTIITIRANNKLEANKAIEDELKKNPSRQPYFDSWVAGGREVLEREIDE